MWPIDFVPFTVENEKKRHPCPRFADYHSLSGVEGRLGLSHPSDEAETHSSFIAAQLCEHPSGLFLVELHKAVVSTPARASYSSVREGTSPRSHCSEQLPTMEALAATRLARNVAQFVEYAIHSPGSHTNSLRVVVVPSVSTKILLPLQTVWPGQWKRSTKGTQIRL